jgi:hypothetical protein
MKPLLFVVCLLVSFISSAHELTGSVGAETRYFPQEALTPPQNYHFNQSFVFQVEYFHEWDDGRQLFAVTPYFRVDQHDPERTHFDIRELTWLKASNQWELRVGVRKVFWGVIEFQHLVDIINQTDLVEDIDAEDKLGQPMLNLALINDWGTLDLFVMPWFRERTFPGTKGRLRTQPRVDTDLSQYESGAKEKHVDFAIRYSHFFGDWDIGLAHFYGTSREPRLLPTVQSAENLLLPFYDIINQSSLDVQATKGNMLWKLEALHRSGQGETYNALAGGFEYTIVGIFSSVIDLGLLAEYHYDERGKEAPTIFDDDIALGTRFAFNDASSSELLAGLLVDKDNGGKFFNIEASRRIAARWFLEMEGRFLFDQDPGDPGFSLRSDDYVELLLTYYY